MKLGSLALLYAMLLAVAPADAYDAASVARVKAGGDCEGCDLAGADLSNLYLDGVLLIDANLRGANLRGSTLSAVLLVDANLRGAKLRGATLYGVILYGANFDGADLSQANIVGAEFDRVSLKGTNVTGTDMSGAQGADLSAAIDNTPPAPAPAPATEQQVIPYGPKIGSVFLVAFTYCPAGSVMAEGATLTIPDNQYLFALYGNAYGGDGTNQFELPDLRAEVPLPGMTFCIVIHGSWPQRN